MRPDEPCKSECAKYKIQALYDDINKLEKLLVQSRERLVRLESKLNKGDGND